MKIWVKILRLYYDIFAKIAPTLRKFEKKRKNLGGCPWRTRTCGRMSSSSIVYFLYGGQGRAAAAAPPRPPQAHVLVLQGAAPHPYEAHVLVLLSVFNFSRFSQYWGSFGENGKRQSSYFHLNFHLRST